MVAVTGRRARQQTGPSLFDELDEQGERETGVFRAAEPQRRARAEKPAPPPVVVPDEVSEILARAAAEHERLDRAIAAARHRIDRPPRCTLDHCSCTPEETTDHA